MNLIEEKVEIKLTDDVIFVNLNEDIVRIQSYPVTLFSNNTFQSQYDVNNDLIVDKSETITERVECGETIGGHKLVYFDGLKIWKADRRDWNKCYVYGLTLQAGNTGDKVYIVKRGIVKNSGWGLTPGYVFLGENGEFAFSPEKNVVCVGYASDSNTLDFNVLYIIKET